MIQHQFHATQFNTIIFCFCTQNTTFVRSVFFASFFRALAVICVPPAAPEEDPDDVQERDRHHKHTC